MDPIKIFYAHSTHQDTIYSVYNSICEKINENNNSMILDIDDENTNQTILKKAQSQIDMCDLFICDITPDYIIEEGAHTLVNPNVMIELGYAHAKNIDIICILNTDITKKVPSMLEGIKYEEYRNDYKIYIDIIIDKINQKFEQIKNYRNNIGWKKIEYNISSILYNCICNIIDVEYGSHIVKINKSLKRAVIMITPKYGGYIRTIDITTKVLFKIDAEQNIKNKKIIDLSAFNDINNELNYLNIIAHIDWFK